MTTAAVDLRSAMSRFATGVTVVTTCDAEGDPVGTTATAVTSLSLAPPLVLVCLARTSNTLAALQGRGAFAVNVLAEQHAALALAFARPGAADGWGPHAPAAGPTGSPFVPDAMAVLDCELHDVLHGGDHAIVVGRVVATETAEDERAPLLSFRRRLAGPGAL